MGDLVLMAALQFADPFLGSPFDTDAKVAAEQRLCVLRIAADQDYWPARTCHSPASAMCEPAMDAIPGFRSTTRSRTDAPTDSRKALDTLPATAIGFSPRKLAV
jgi:hypothetical protein